MPGTKKISSWDDAIADAKQRIRDMEFSLRVFQERKRKREPWPLDNKAGRAEYFTGKPGRFAIDLTRRGQ